MKKCILIILGFAAIILNAQDNKQDKASLRLIADRNTYIAGETMNFFVIDISAMQLSDKVLYAELISSNGTRITSGKFIFEGGRATGCLAIPKDLVSGYYFARAYTKTMRNAGPESYDYIPVTVFNPSKAELVQPENTDPVHNLAIDSIQSGLFLFDNLKNRYAARTKVAVTMKSLKPETTELKGICISVIPAGTSAKYHMGFSRENSERMADYAFYPEDQGLTITGQLVDKDQNVPIQDKVVTMSVIGGKDFSGYRTDRDGRFYFRLPAEYGKKDVFLSTIEGSFQVSQLLIDNDYCSLPVNLPAEKFAPKSAEKMTALKMANNFLLSTIFPNSQSSPIKDTAATTGNAFYGEPSGILKMSDYVQLPTLEEYFYELPIEVKIHKTKSGRTFRFHEQGGNMLINEPLILVDWVVINNPEKVLSIQPQKIERIETVNRPYVKGNLTYGGIISIISKEGDFAGIDLPSSGIFINYDFFKPLCDSCCNFAGRENQPDTRNTIFWQPDINVQENTHELSFETPDTPGIYEIVVRGSYPDGRFYCQSVSFEVK